MKQRGIDPPELATRLGYSDRATVDHWLSGRRKLTRTNLGRVAEILKCDPHEIDPEGNGYTAAQRKARAKEKKALQTSHGRADTLEVTQTHAPPEETLFMEPGGLPPLPNMGLFSQVIGWWRVLSPEQRRKFVDQGRKLALGEVVEFREARRKKAAR